MAQLKEAPTLDCLPIGSATRVLTIEGGTTDPVGSRLTDLGFIAGTPIKVVRRAPLGDPTVLELRGYQMCLRRAEMQRIVVERLGK
jgi:ferrous iron transport protein A